MSIANISVNYSSLGSSKPQLNSKVNQKTENLIDFQKTASSATAQPNLSWNDKLIEKIENKWERALEAKFPNNPLQKKIDILGRKIESKFSGLTKFNAWLDGNGNGDWYKRLATFLIKLPARAVRNVIRMLYSIIKAVLYASVHPLKAMTKLAKMIVRLMHALTKPETWTKIGAGVIGANLGQLAVTGNLATLIGLGIGSAMMIGGMSSGALIAMLNAPKGQELDRLKQELTKQMTQIPEALLTGFLIGLLIGAIQKNANTGEAQQYPNRQVRISPDREGTFNSGLIREIFGKESVIMDNNGVLHRLS